MGYIDGQGGAATKEGFGWVEGGGGGPLKHTLVKWMQAVLV